LEDAAENLYEEMQEVEGALPGRFDADVFLENRAATVLQEEIRGPDMGGTLSDASRLLRPGIEYLVRSTPNERLPGVDEINEVIVRQQVLLMLPESQRDPDFIDHLTNQAMYELSELTDRQLRNLLRAELNARGSMVRGAVPEEIIFRALRYEMRTSGLDPAEHGPLRARINERMEMRHSDAPVRELAECFRRATRLVER
jgi:hypothetical protein